MLKNMPQVRKLDRTRLPCLRKVEKGKLFTEIRKVNKLLKKIKPKDVTENNNLLYLYCKELKLKLLRSTNTSK